MSRLPTLPRRWKRRSAHNPYYDDGDEGDRLMSRRPTLPRRWKRRSAQNLVLRRRRRGGRSPLAVWLAGLSPGTVRTANAKRAFCYLAVCSYETAVGEDAVVSTTSELPEHGRDDAVP